MFVQGIETQKDESVMESQQAEKSLSRLQTFYGHLNAHDLMRVMVEEEFPDQIALLSSFGADSAMLISILAEVNPDVPILFLETHKHFPETLAYIKTLEAKFGLTNIQYLEPDKTLVNNIDKDGNLWESQPNRCCWLRKVEPLDRAMKEFGYKALITGRKYYQTKDRENAPSIEKDEDGIFKVNPIISWTKEQFKEEFIARDLPPHPLVANNYLSIGCMPCTRPVKEGEDERAGRWAHTDNIPGSDKKTECGLHISKSPDWSV
ncbi:MAG: phosphoadenylyl-sulfate reductase [Rickettsiales bacterium]|nr:phosphoadenylyl-sulfate reductase [Rickettsiales bacterium]